MDEVGILRRGKGIGEGGTEKWWEGVRRDREGGREETGRMEEEGNEDENTYLCRLLVSSLSPLHQPAVFPSFLCTVPVFRFIILFGINFTRYYTHCFFF